MNLHSAWRWLSAHTLSGLLLLVPLVITVQFIVWLSRNIEAVLKPLVSSFIPESWYVPGLAVLLFLLLALVLGVATRNVLLQKVVELTESAMTRLPVIGSIYPVVRQLTDLISGKGSNEGGSVVLVNLPDSSSQVIGIVTRPAAGSQLPWLPADCDLVFVPMSYQMGGFTLVLPRSQLQPLPMSAGEALQMIIMGGMVQPKSASQQGNSIG